MSVTVSTWDDLGDGKLRVFARTGQGNPIDVVIRRDQLGGADMWAVLEAAAIGRDKLMGAIKARAGKSDSEE